MAKDDLVETATNGAGSGDIVRSALEHKELLVPAAAAVAAALAAAKAPSVARGLSSSVEEKVDSTAETVGAKAVEGAKENIGGSLGGGGLVGKALGKLTGLGGGGNGGGGGGKKTRRLPIQRWTDVAVPVEQAYEAWTKFDQFPKFMHRVLSVEQKEGDDDKVSWQEKIWFSKRQWEGQITERRENDRIVWKTTSGMSHKGIISFHKLDERLTRVMVEMEFEPNGMIEKMGSGLRFVKRAVQSDLARFKAYVEMRDAKGIEYRSAEQQQDGDQEQAGGDEEQEDGEAREARQARREARATRSSAAGSSSTRSSSSARKRASAKRGSAKRSSAKSSSAKSTRASSTGNSTSTPKS
jgi:uncharacterized membrane protein